MKIFGDSTQRRLPQRVQVFSDSRLDGFFTLAGLKLPRIPSSRASIFLPWSMRFRNGSRTRKKPSACRPSRAARMTACIACTVSWKGSG